MYKQTVGLFTFSILLFICFLWIETNTRDDLERRLSVWTSRSAKISDLSLGLFESDIKNIYIPTKGTSRFTNDIEVGLIKVTYSPTALRDNLTTIQTVDIAQLTIHWNGLLGRNIQELTSQIRTAFPKRKVRSNKQSDSSIKINRLTVYDTTIFLHIGNHTETLRLPILQLHNVEGTHQSILKQILEQIQIGMEE